MELPCSVPPYGHVPLAQWFANVAARLYPSIYIFFSSRRTCPHSSSVCQCPRARVLFEALRGAASAASAHIYSYVGKKFIWPLNYPFACTFTCVVESLVFTINTKWHRNMGSNARDFSIRPPFDRRNSSGNSFIASYFKIKYIRLDDLEIFYRRN